MRIVRYKVRSVRKIKATGDTEALRWTFKVESAALEKLRRQMRRGHKVTIRKDVEIVPFEIITEWGNTTTRPPAPKPIKTLVVHHSFSQQLSPDASMRQEKAQMRQVQATGFARGLGGFSYGLAVPPSGRCYKGSGWGVVEAATGGLNTPTDSIVLLGNYDVFEPTEEQVDTIVNAGKWGKRNGYFVKVIDVDPHSDHKATACPGRFTRFRLAEIERRINS